jgi:hypothetical protein
MLKVVVASNLFDYEQMRKQAQNRSNQEMADWEAVALASDVDRPVVVDGRLEPRLRAAETSDRSLVVGVIKQHAVPYLHRQGFRALLDLRPGQRTPFFLRFARVGGGFRECGMWDVGRVEE